MESKADNSFFIQDNMNIKATEIEAYRVQPCIVNIFPCQSMKNIYNHIRS